MRMLTAILLGGLAAGALDIISAFATFLPQGASVSGILHYIASGLIGADAANSGGLATAGLGLAVHFALTTAMAGAYVVAARLAPLLARAPLVCGAIYGVGLYALMTYVIVPMSAAPGWKPAEGWMLASGLFAHTALVGIPIALIAKRFMPPTESIA
ncbi:MAG TPA: hypothetical protein VG841_04105 [Caulobacterales bacterium]|nr:hypothetical protein [Caulobacterales bacterium]